jgi:hypothetical protein
MSPVDATLSVAGAVALGCAGWFATNFLARPLLRVYELREKVWEELLVTANVTMFDEGVSRTAGRSCGGSRPRCRRSTSLGRATCAACSPWLASTLPPAPKGFSGCQTRSACRSAAMAHTASR